MGVGRLFAKTRECNLCNSSSEEITHKDAGVSVMAVRVVEFSNQGYKIRKIFA